MQWNAIGDVKICVSACTNYTHITKNISLQLVCTVYRVGRGICSYTKRGWLCTDVTAILQYCSSHLEQFFINWQTHLPQWSFRQSSGILGLYWLGHFQTCCQQSGWVHRECDTSFCEEWYVPWVIKMMNGELQWGITMTNPGSQPNSRGTSKFKAEV